MGRSSWFLISSCVSSKEVEMMAICTQAKQVAQGVIKRTQQRQWAKGLVFGNTFPTSMFSMMMTCSSWEQVLLKCDVRGKVGENNLVNTHTVHTARKTKLIKRMGPTMGATSYISTKSKSPTRERITVSKHFSTGIMCQTREGDRRLAREGFSGLHVSIVTPMVLQHKTIQVFRQHIQHNGCTVGVQRAAWCVCTCSLPAAR